MTVVDYVASWPGAFERLRARFLGVAGDIALAVEHVGSTAVPGLAAKPIIDISIVVPSREQLPLLIGRLAGLGYVHRGDLGIEGREAFDTPPDPIAHHVYGCARDSLALQNHLAVREYLRSHPAAVTEYAALKKRLAQQFPGDAARYTQGKTDFLLQILRAANFTPAGLESVERANRRAVGPPFR